MEKRFLIRIIIILLFLWLNIVKGDVCHNVGCVTDLQPKDCPAGTFYLGNEGLCKCPTCLKKLDVGQGCRFDTECKPGLKCEGRLCVPDDTSCFSKSGEIYPPACSPDGKYGPVQCKGDRIIGRCFCSDEDGNRIYGWGWRTEEKDMTCACSRKRQELLKTKTTITLHCTPNGNFEKIQCDSGLCWCADEKTGDAISVVLPDNLISQLPCYDPEIIGSQYTRVCESKAIAMEAIKEKLVLHGTLLVSMEKVFCDYDGTYGTFQIHNGIAYCSWKDGTRIANFQVSAGVSLLNVNCYCARDMKYFEEAGKMMIQDCSGNGNYMLKQQINGQVYCVDQDGFPVSDLQDLGTDIDCGGPPARSNFTLTESKVYAAMIAKMNN